MRISNIKKYLQRRLRVMNHGIDMGIRLGSNADLMKQDISSIIIGDEKKTIRLPDEIGCKAAFIEVLLEDGYFLSEIKTPIHTVVDIGANAGVFCLAARHYFPDAIIHAYEPNVHLEPYLKHQCQAVNATYYIEAVQRESGFINLLLNEQSVAASTQFSLDGNVPATAFREVINRIGGQVDIVKMDCEGAEWEILDDTLAWARVKYLALEYHLLGKYSAKYAIEIVQKLGFQLRHHVPLPNDVGIIVGKKGD